MRVSSRGWRLALALTGTAKAKARAREKAKEKEKPKGKVKEPAPEPEHASFVDALKAAFQCTKCEATTYGTKGCRGCMGKWFEEIRCQRAPKEYVQNIRKFSQKKAAKAKAEAKEGKNNKESEDLGKAELQAIEDAKNALSD